EAVVEIGAVMIRKTLSAVFSFAAVACHPAPGENASAPARATGELQALLSRDAEALEQCEQALNACNASLPDAASAGVCARLAERCAALQELLAELRAPTEGCLRAAEACERAPHPARCSRDVDRCATLDRDASPERDQTLACEARVAACLVRARELPAPALAAC